MKLTGNVDLELLHTPQKFCVYQIENSLDLYVDFELHSVIRFFIMKGKSKQKIHRELCSVYVYDKDV